MTRKHLTLLVAPVVAGVLMAPAAAGAKLNKTVYAGPPPNTNTIAAKYIPHLKQFGKRYSPDINAFFNKRTKINVGDSITFKIHGFHSVDLPGKSGKDLPFTVPGSGTVGQQNDAGGNPFWFSNLVPPLGPNPLLFSRSKAKTYDGTARLDSGLISSKPLKVKFIKAGTYKFFCDVHPGMVGFIVVKPKGVSIPTAKQDAAAEVKQVTRDVKAIKKALKAKLPADTVDLGLASSGGTELFAMFPRTLTVPAGTKVTFRMTPKSDESHTATFGPTSYLGPLAKSFQGSPQFAPPAVYPSDPPGTVTETPTSHGNGFANTGTLDTDPTSKQVPSSSTIDFTVPGTYTYYCLIHPQMVGTIVVK